MTDNDSGGGKEMVRSSGGRPFQRRGTIMDMMMPGRSGNIPCK